MEAIKNNAGSMFNHEILKEERESPKNKGKYSFENRHKKMTLNIPNIWR